MLKAAASQAAADRSPTTWPDRLRSLIDVRYLAAVTAAATYGLIVLGGTVRATDSGLACPDWPRCHGQLIPPLESHVLIEYSHRLAAASVGLLVLALAATAWLWQRDRPLVSGGAAIALLLLVVQVLVGGVTVNMELPDTIVALHLAIALTFLAVLLFTTLAAFQKQVPVEDSRASSRSFLLLAVAALATLILILTGSYVANSGAALVYPDWPLFNGKLVSAGGRLADLHYAHRLLAAVVGLLLLSVLLRAWRERRPFPMVTLGAAMALYIAQVLVGASNIWLELATSVRVVHLALASALWATLMLALSWSYLGQRAGG